MSAPCSSHLKTALPVATAAWCRGRRASRYLTPDPDAERQTALRLAARASNLNAGDLLTEVMLASAYTLAHDLDAATRHTARALMLDGGSAWAWGRSGRNHAFRGAANEAIEHFQIARSLAPADPLSYSWSTGIGSAHFMAGRYKEAASWYRRVLVERPKGIWVNRFLSASCVLADRKEICFRRAFDERRKYFSRDWVARVHGGQLYRCMGGHNGGVRHHLPGGPIRRD